MRNSGTEARSEDLDRPQFAGVKGAPTPGLATKLAIMVTGIVAALLIGEVALRLISPFPKGFWTWPPGFQKTFFPDSAIMQGVNGPSRFIVNTAGIRGPEFTDDQGYRVLTIGGSTTECLYLDQDKAWPSVLEQQLNRERPDLKVWVGNLGKSGFNTSHHLVQVKYQLPQLPRLDVLMLLLGANDLSKRLIAGNSCDPFALNTDAGEQRQIRRTFWYYPLGWGGLKTMKDTAWGRLISFAVAGAFSPMVQDDQGKSMVAFRERRRNALEMRDRLPDLGSGLDEYAGNLDTIIDLARKRSARVILVTQPHLFHQGMTEAETNLLWSGGAEDFENIGRGTYYSVPALISGIGRYNSKLMEVCVQKGVECIDLAARLPKDTSVFYDDYHFNDNGSRQVGTVISEYVLSKPPFSTTGGAARSQ